MGLVRFHVFKPMVSLVECAKSLTLFIILLVFKIDTNFGAIS